MSSVLHPVGPEEPQTYWVRRAIVVGAAVLALIVVIAIIVSQTSSGSVVAQPTPSALDPSPPAATTPTYTPTPSATPSEPTDQPPTSSPKASRSSKAGKDTTTKPSASPSTKTASASCPADELRATLTGKQRLKPKQPNTFTVSLINGSGARCQLDVSSKNFELKIYSGRDRIWSSDDCAKSVKAIDKSLAKEQSVEWKMTWDGRRSRAECKQRPEIPKAGTYFATAQFEGAEPVQLRMILRG